MTDLNTMEPFLLVARLVELRRLILESWDRVSELKGSLPDLPDLPDNLSEETERVMGLITAEMDRAYELEGREHECMEVMMKWNVEEVLYRAGVNRFYAMEKL